MPSYNTARFLEDSVRSVLNQTYQNWELIIVDDCSCDHPESVISRFCDPRIRYMRNENNSGAALSRNRALREARGRYIAFLDSDDLWDPEKLECQLAFMKERNCAFSYTCYREIDEASNPLGRIVSGPKRITRKGMYRYCWPGCLTVMYDSNVVGLIQVADIRKNNDYAMWLKICKKADCLLLDQVLASYRRREGSISNHSYLSLVRWHYRLFRQAEGMGKTASIICTGRNLFFGLQKKIYYVKNRSAA